MGKLTPSPRLIPVRGLFTAGLPLADSTIIEAEHFGGCTAEDVVNTVILTVLQTAL